MKFTSNNFSIIRIEDWRSISDQGISLDFKCFVKRRRRRCLRDHARENLKGNNKSSHNYTLLGCPEASRKQRPSPGLISKGVTWCLDLRKSIEKHKCPTALFCELSKNWNDGISDLFIFSWKIAYRICANP